MGWTDEATGSRPGLALFSLNAVIDGWIDHLSHNPFWFWSGVMDNPAAERRLQDQRTDRRPCTAKVAAERGPAACRPPRALCFIKVHEVADQLQCLGDIVHRNRRANEGVKEEGKEEKEDCGTEPSEGVDWRGFAFSLSVQGRLLKACVPSRSLQSAPEGQLWP